MISENSHSCSRIGIKKKKSTSYTNLLVKFLTLARTTNFEPTNTHVSSLAACQRVLAAAGAGVHRNGFADDKTILHQFTDLLACEKNMVKTQTNVRSWKFHNAQNKVLRHLKQQHP